MSDQKRLPNYRHAIIAERKIREYLLSSSHPDGRDKATFFQRFGYSEQRWQELASALRQHIARRDVVQEQDTAYGRRYIVEGTISAADGRAPRIRSVWFIDSDEVVPRLVTAYPLPESR